MKKSVFEKYLFKNTFPVLLFFAISQPILAENNFSNEEDRRQNKVEACRSMAVGKKYYVVLPDDFSSEDRYLDIKPKFSFFAKNKFNPFLTPHLTSGSKKSIKHGNFDPLFDIWSYRIYNKKNEQTERVYLTDADASELVKIDSLTGAAVLRVSDGVGTFEIEMGCGFLSEPVTKVRNGSVLAEANKISWEDFDKHFPYASTEVIDIIKEKIRAEHPKELEGLEFLDLPIIQGTVEFVQVKEALYTDVKYKASLSYSYDGRVGIYNNNARADSNGYVILYWNKKNIKCSGTYDYQAPNKGKGPYRSINKSVEVLQEE